MKKKIVIALIAVAIIAAAVAAAVFVVNKDVAEMKTTEAVTVTDESVPEVEPAANAEQMDEESEEAIEIVELFGVITEITDEYVMIDAGEMGQIQANVSDDTLIEGVEELAIGQTAVIKYDGKMTRSLPAQITALHIGVYEVKGTVTAVEDGRVTIAKSEGGDEVVLTPPQGAPQIAVGDAITAYTTGVSTMSLPPQMNAIALVK